MAETTGSEEVDQVEGPTRRGVLNMGLTTMIGTMMATAMGLPVLTFFAAPVLQGPGNDNWTPIGTPDEFGEERKEVEYAYQQQDGWYSAAQTRRVVVGKEQGQLVVFSTQCTHVGCGVTWQPGEKPGEGTFYCPCHGGVFNADGSVQVPPPEKPLERLKWRVNPQTGQLEVRNA